MSNFINNTRSSYAYCAEGIHEATGRDCSMLTAEQMDEVGMAAERAWLDWEWAEVAEIVTRLGMDVSAADEVSDEHKARVKQAQSNVKACKATTENELVGLYVGGFYDDYSL